MHGDDIYRVETKADGPAGSLPLTERCSATGLPATSSA